jgi:hypothetical protein
MENGGDLPYTGGTQIDPGYEEFMRKQEQDYLLSQGRIRESMPAPDPSIMDRLLQGGKESGPNYNLIAPSVDKYAPSMGERFGSFVSGLKDKDYSLPTQEILDALSRGMAPFSSGSNALDNLQEIDMSSIPKRIDMESLPPAVRKDAMEADPDNMDKAAVEAGLAATTPEKKAAADITNKSSDPDYEALRSTLDSFKPVDYSAFKPNYLDLITEQERRAQKIRDDASKDASAQALIQLGAGLAAGDVSKGLSSAGQAVADIKRQARAEARDEEGFARQLRLAEDEAAMRLGVQGAEAERELARFKATYGVNLAELEQTLTLARERIEAEAKTESGRALRGRLEALNNLIQNLIANQYEGDAAQNKKAISEAMNEMQYLLGITGEKQDKSSNTDVIEAAKAIVGNR